MRNCYPIIKSQSRKAPNTTSIPVGFGTYLVISDNLAVLLACLLECQNIAYWDVKSHTFFHDYENSYVTYVQVS